MRARLSLTALLLTLSAATPAYAQLPFWEELWSVYQGNRVGIEGDFLYADADIKRDDGSVFETNTLAIPFSLVAQIKLYRGLHLDLEVPFAFAEVSNPTTVGEDRGGLIFGNPTLGLHYTYAPAKWVALVGGLHTAVATSWSPGDDPKIAASTAAITRAYVDTHRYRLERVVLRPRAGTEMRFLDMFYLRSDLAAAMAIPSDDGETDFIIEQGNELEMRGRGGLGMGVRFQQAIRPGADDAMQLAVEPFLNDEPKKSGMYFRLGLLFALDEPLGFGFDDGKVATLRVALGGKF